MSLKSFGREPLNSHDVRLPRGHVFLIPNRCKGCGICIEFCPRDVLQESRKANAKGYHLPEIRNGEDNPCIHCQFCSLVCPEFAIFTEEVPH